jgi:TatD DNase family protein
MALSLFDTHCHLNFPDAFSNPGAEVSRAKSAGVDRLCLVGIDLESSLRAVEIAEKHEGVFAVVGWHPNSAATFSEGGLASIEGLLGHPKAAALGEIGLDYHWDYATPLQQRSCLEAQLGLFERREMPTVFHCRDAYDDLLAILENRLPGRFLFHCFSGDERHAERVRSLDGWIGVGGPLTYKKSESLREICRAWPRNRLVLETDSPYLSPEPFRGKPNHPAHLPLIGNRLAELWETTPEAVAEQTVANAIEFFRIAEA